MYVLARLSFCDTWRKWIVSYIFSSHVSILVNGSPIDDSQIKLDLDRKIHLLLLHSQRS